MAQLVGMVLKMLRPMAPALLAEIAFAASASAIEDWGPVASHVQGGIIAVDVTAVCAGQEKAVEWRSSGTAFLIANDGQFMTAAHIFPACDTFQTLLIEGELRPPLTAKTGPARFRLLFRERATKYDVAIIQTDSETLNKTVLPVTFEPHRLGVPLAALGYPIGDSMHFAAGPVAGEGAEETWMINAIVQEGFSGAPVIAFDGKVVGMVRGGNPVADVPADKHVMGLALFVPAQRLFDALPRYLGANWSAVPERIKDPAKAVPLVISRSINATRDVHSGAESSGNYGPFEIEAPPGYRIEKATFESFSETRADRRIAMVGERKAVLTFSLRSGPLYDRYRGWLKGNFVVTLVPEEDP